jgi:hypothetical protein
VATTFALDISETGGIMSAAGFGVLRSHAVLYAIDLALVSLCVRFL